MNLNGGPGIERRYRPEALSTEALLDALLALLLTLPEIAELEESKGFVNPQPSCFPSASE